MIGADYTKRDIILGKDRDWRVRAEPPRHDTRRPAARTIEMTVGAGNARTRHCST
jgi:hypothetical protein